MALRTIKEDEKSYKLFWSNNYISQGGVVIMVNSDLVKNVIEVRHVITKMIIVEIAIKNQIVTFFSMYPHQCVCDTEEKNIFYNDLSMEMVERTGKMCGFG